MDTRSKQTTGWTEETRNQFHPGDIITAIRIDYTGYSPHNAVGLTELACHYLGEGRESCKPYISEKGDISGFYFNVIPRVKKIQNDLRREFPELAHFADSLSKINLEEIFASPTQISLLVEEIEKKFGKTISVSPLNANKENTKSMIEDGQASLLSMFKNQGLNVFLISENEAKNDAGKKCKL